MLVLFILTVRLTVRTAYLYSDLIFSPASRWLLRILFGLDRHIRWSRRYWMQRAVRERRDVKLFRCRCWHVPNDPNWPLLCSGTPTAGSARQAHSPS